jgi:transposase-like protein
MAERDLTALKLAYGVKPSVFSRLWRARGDSGVVTYCVQPAPSPKANVAPKEKRRAQRRRTRLRAGKILDLANRFVIEAAILDRSNDGLRLRLARDSAIPEVFHLFDEETQMIFGARLVWRRQAMVGARLEPGGPLAATPRQIAALRGKFYAMRD